MNEKVQVPARKWTSSKGKWIRVGLNNSVQHEALYHAIHRDAEKERISISQKVRHLLLKTYKIEGE